MRRAAAQGTRAGVIFSLFLLIGCAAGQGLPGVIALVLSLSFFTACSNLFLKEDHSEDFLLRSLLSLKSASSSSTTGCTSTVDYSQSFDFSTIDPATQGIGYKITGQNSGDFFGSSVGGAGDFNGDGIGDIIVAAKNYNTNVGRVYVLFGQSGDGADIDTSALTTSQGIYIDGPAANSHIGWQDTARGMGDFNGDGFDDIIFGGYRASSNRGRTWVILGNANPTNITAIGSITTSQGAAYYGGATSWWSGYGIGATGDVNGDGLNDFVIGAYYGPSGSGDAYIVYGKSTPTAAAVDLSTITGSSGFHVQSGSSYVYGVSGAGDLNGDGINEMLIGSSDGNRVYVIYGESGTARTSINAGSLAASDGFTITTGTNRLGQIMSGGGDFNGDGTDDFVIADDVPSTNTGRTMLLYGNTGDLTVGSHTAAQGSLLSGDSGGLRTGSSVSLRGDVNGDGQVDLLVGARGASYSASNSGSAYLIFGQSGIAANSTLNTFNNGTDGIRLDGPATANMNLGFSVDLADVNGDSCGDMIMSAHGNGANTGEVYVIFGGQAQ